MNGSEERRALVACRRFGRADAVCEGQPREQYGRKSVVGLLIKDEGEVKPTGIYQRR